MMDENIPPIDGTENDSITSTPVAPTEHNSSSFASTGTNKQFISNRGWKVYAGAAFIVVFAGLGLYMLLTSLAATPTVTKTWSSAGDWNSGTLNDTIVTGNTVALASTTSTTGVASSCNSSPVVLNNSGGSITDSANAKWTVSRGVVSKNGSTSAAGFTANVTEIAYVNKVIWQENSSKLWWSWNGNGWSGGKGIATSPLSGGGSTTKTTYASSGTITLTVNAAATATWDSLADQATTPSGTAVTTEARTSTNGTTWSAWTTNIKQAATSQYLQVRATLTSSKSSATPTLNSLTLTYTSTATTPPPTQTPPPPTAGTNATVDFTKDVPNISSLNTYSIGDTISTYGGTTANIQNATWRNTLAALGPLAWRIPLRYNGGNPVGGGSGGGGDGVSYIKDIKDIGGVPVVIVAGTSTDNNVNSTDAGNFVKFFNANGGQNGGPVNAWIIGNEPDNTGGTSPYLSMLPTTAANMKAADSSITISAGAAAYFDNGFLQSVANSSAAPDITYLSYHGYEGGDGKGQYATPDYLAQAQAVAKMGKIPALEEFNWNSACASNSQGVYNTWQNEVYMASIIGNSLAGGAHAYMYSDSNGCGTLSDGSNNGGLPLGTQLPAYWALGMWTGMNGEFDRFGSQLVDSSVNGVDVTNASGKDGTGLAHEVELYATNNGKILAINKNATTNESLVIGIGGYTTGTYNVWQTNQKDATGSAGAPKEVTTNAAFNGGKISITLPAGTISSIDVK